MKLGTQTGSLVNHIYSRMTNGQPTPEVGMGATLLSWTDRHAATIVHVNGMGDLIIVQEDHAVRTDANGMSESQAYHYTANPHGALYTFRKTKTGAWQEVYLNEKTGRYNKTDGLRIGERQTYRDFSF